MSTTAVVAQILAEMIEKVANEIETGEKTDAQPETWEQTLLKALMRHPETGKPISYAESRYHYG